MPQQIPLATTLAERVERRVQGAMVLLTLLFLVVLAGMLPQSLSESVVDQLYLAQRFAVVLGVLWAVFLAEFLVVAVLYGSRRSLKRHGLALLGALIPPLRPSMRPAFAPDFVWIPLLGWRRSDKELMRELEERVNGPMTIVALMILPVLGMEFIWHETLHENFLLLGSVEVGTRFIWLAFAMEFFTMVSVARQKVDYCKTHWIDLLIIIMPLVAFLRVLRLARLGRLTHLQRMSRVYRMRGIFYRLMRATVLLNGLVRANRWLRTRRMGYLRKKLAQLTEQAEEVRCELEELEAEEVGESESDGSAEPELAAQRQER